MKKIFFILLFSGCTLFDDDNEISQKIFAGSELTLDIASWNIENFPKNESTVDFLFPIIDSLNVDIVALQEIESTIALNNLTENLGDDWTSFRSENTSYGELSYLINTNIINITTSPYKILNSDYYYFAYREPYVLEFEYNNTDYVLINIHYKCCDGSEQRRLQASVILKNYIDENFSDFNVIVVGDFNDNLIDDENVFVPFLTDSTNYMFTDYSIAQGNSFQWSFPTYPSHIDHILVSSELFDNVYNTEVLLIDQWFFDGFSDYNLFVSDHRPIVLQLDTEP